MNIRVVVVLVALTFLCTAAHAQSLYVTWPSLPELLQDSTYTLEWVAAGAQTINIVLHGIRTPLGTTSRGGFDTVLVRRVPAVDGVAEIKLPWVDALTFTVKVKAYDGVGRQVALDERTYAFRPGVLANRTTDGIYLDLHEPDNQRLYVQKDRRITRIYISSSSENYLWLPANRHIEKPHDHAGVFRVQEKMPSYYSRQYRVPMPWAMRYNGGHFIHATSANLYRLLGRPASHGCNRLTRYDAKQLYDMTPAGARVEIIGPKG